MSKERPRVVAVVINNKRVLLLHRWNNGEEYYILPGGGQEQGETLKETITREIKEELNLKVKNLKRLFKFTNLGHQEYYYLITEFSGSLKVIGDSSEEKKIKDRIVWSNLEKLKGLNLLPLKAKKRILTLLKNY